MAEQTPFGNNIIKTDNVSATPSLKQEMNLARRACWCNNERYNAQKRCENCEYTENIIENENFDGDDNDDDDDDDDDNDNNGVKRVENILNVKNSDNNNKNVTTVLNGAILSETTNLIENISDRNPKVNSTTKRKLSVKNTKDSGTINANLNVTLSNKNLIAHNYLINFDDNNTTTSSSTTSNIPVDDNDNVAANVLTSKSKRYEQIQRFWLAFVAFCDRMTLKIDDPRFANGRKSKSGTFSAQNRHSNCSKSNGPTPSDTSKSKKPGKFKLMTSKKVIFLFLVCVFFSCVKRSEARPNNSTTTGNAISSENLLNGGAASAGLLVPDNADQKQTAIDSNGDGASTAMAPLVDEHHPPERFPLSQVDFDRVKTPFIIGIWILSASIAKIGFHMTPKLHLIFPESCLLIVVGVVIGVVLYFGTEVAVSPLTPNTFFFYMLPPIILDAGYFMPNRLFFDNLGTILLMAVVGTIFNIATIGGSLWAIGLTGLYGDAVTPRFLDTFIFASLISAVDPVAVLAVFEEIHVNEILYIVVFGESLLNDAVTVVMYHMMEVYNEIGISEIIAQDIASGVGSFFVVAIGGTFIGIIWGFLTGLVTRFTDHVRVIEPIFIFVMAYLAYLNAEIFHMSGILAITFCGITMKNYVESNISQKSHTTVKYALKMLSSSSETIIFMFLGVATVKNNHVWNTWFVLLTIVFCSVYRVIGVIILTALANRFRLHKLSRVDQFVMSYGGLRGAVAFALVLLINDEVVKDKDMFVTTTIAVIYFTVFLQGITIKPLVRILNVKRANKRKPTMNERIHERFMDHLMAGIEDIVGKTGNYNVRDKFKRFDNRFIRPLLIRDLKGAEPKIIETYSKLTMRDAMEVMRRNPSTIGQITGTESMSALFRNYTNNCIGGSPSLTNLENTCSRNLDMHELDYNPSRKDLTDAKIHHLLAEELKPYRRHRRLSYSRHAVDDRDLSTQVNYKLQMNFRRMFNDRKHHKRSKRGNASNKQLQPDAAGVKQNHVSFHDFQQNGTTKQFTNEDNQPKLTEVTVQSANDDWDDGLTFTAKSSLAENPIPEEDRNVSRDSDGGERRVATPTATESQLPWKRQEDEISDAVQQNEFPAWASNKEYLAYNSPSATFLGGINKPKQPKSVIGLFRRESSKSGGSVSNDAILAADILPAILAPRGSDPALAAMLSGMIVPSVQYQHPPRMDKRSQSISAGSGIGEGHAGPFPVTASHRRNVRRGSMLELSGEPIPEETYHHGYSKSLCEPDAATSGDEWASVHPERASSAGGNNNDRFLRTATGGASAREPLLPKLTPRAQIRRMGGPSGSRTQVTSSLLSSNSDFDDDEDEDLDLYDDENIVVTTTTTNAAGAANGSTDLSGRNRSGSASGSTTTTTIRLGRNNDESII